jgi:hypothetical protein
LLSFCLGFKFQFGSPLHALHGILSPTGTKDDQDETTGIAVSEESIVVSDASPDDIMNGTGETVTSGIFRSKFQTLVKCYCLSSLQNLFICWSLCYS